MEALVREGCLRADHGRPGLRRGRAEDSHDRCNLPESPPHGIEPGGEKRGRGRPIGRTKGGLNTKLHAVADAKGRPLKFFMTAGQVSDYMGAVALLRDLPKAEWLLADRGYDADWYREALKDKGEPEPPAPEPEEEPEDEDPTRPPPLQTTQSDRDHVWPSQGLAQDRHPLRPMPQGLPLSRRPRRNRHVLAMKQERVLTLAFMVLWTSFQSCRSICRSYFPARICGFCDFFG